MAHRRVISAILLALLTASVLLASLPSSPVAISASKTERPIARAEAGLSEMPEALKRARGRATAPPLPWLSDKELPHGWPYPRPELHKDELAGLGNLSSPEHEPMAVEPKPLTPGPGDWVVSGEEVRRDETIILTGNLIVQPGGNLTLTNCTLYMNCSCNGEWQIKVESGGVMNVLEGSNITAYVPEFDFLFYVYGSLTMRDSELHECGYEWDYPGLWLETDEGVIIENCTITNCYDGIRCEDSSDITITNCEISQNYDGIFCRDSSDITITDCEISQNYDGIDCWDSSNIAITDCEISQNYRIGIYCYYCCNSDISVTDCEISQNEWAGVYCYESSDITIMNCEISQNNYDGIDCYYSSDITIRNNVFSYDGVFLWGDGICHCASHTIEDNTVNGKPLYYIVNVTGPYTVPSDAGQVIIVNSTHIRLANMNLSYTDIGLEIVYAEDVHVENSIISQNDDDGIYCRGSSDITITDCEISQNDYGIYCERSSNIVITSCEINQNDRYGIYCYYCCNSDISVTDCEISQNEWAGVYCWCSSDITIRNNVFSYDGVFLRGEKLCHYASHTIEDNTVNGKPLYYIVNITGPYNVPSNAGQIIIVNSTHIRLTGANLSCTCIGLEIAYSKDIQVENYIINQDLGGIVCEQSSGITITNCTISQDGYGIYCYWSNTTVHYCNIFSNDDHGLYVKGAYVVNATYNWWGSPDGPEYQYYGDPYDPEEVYSQDGPEYVLYDPWLTEPIDLAPPSVEITAPQDGSFVRGTVLIQVSATDNIGVDRVEFYVDDTLVCTDAEAPYEFEWNTTTWPDGEHIVKAVAYDLAGNKAEESISVVVDNTPPMIGSVQHSPGEPSPGQEVAVTASVSDATSGLERVVLYYRVDDGEWQSLEMAQQDGAWVATIPGQSEGSVVEYYVEARDKAGNTAKSDKRSYTVKASQQAPPGGGGQGGWPSLPSELFGIPLDFIISMASLAVALIALIIAVKALRAVSYTPPPWPPRRPS